MPRLVLIGGGHAHLLSLSRIDEFIRRGHQVTLISPECFHYYSGMGPGLLGGCYRPAEARFDVERMVTARGGRFRRDSVVRIDPLGKRLVLASGESLDYDVASCNVGSEVVMDGFTPGPKLVPVKPVVNLERARRRLLEHSGSVPLSLAVVGAGPAGCEVAGNLRRLLDDRGLRGTVQLFSGGKLLAGTPQGVSRHLRRNFVSRGVVIRDERVLGGEDGVLSLDDGSEGCFDLVVLASGIRPPRLFADSGLAVGSDGGLVVNRFLQTPAAPELFGGGDCIFFSEQSLPKVGVHAVRQGPLLRHNLLAALEGRPLKSYRPQKHCLLILNAGDGRGVAWRRSWVLDGRLAFRFKEWLDRGFMRRFQLCGELEDEG